MPGTGPKRVYISSPRLGLESAREAVVEAVRRLEHLPVHMERYGADVRSALDRVRADVRACDAYVLVLGWRYGTIVEGKSYTHWEYEAARDYRKPMFVYLTPRREQGAQEADPVGSPIDAWRATLASSPSTGSLPFQFRSIEELEKQVLADLGRWLGAVAPAPRTAATQASTDGMCWVADAQAEHAGFWIDRCAVTNDEFARFAAETGYEPREPGGFLAHWGGAAPPRALRRHPVVCVSAHDAEAFAAWAGKALPTRREWERAALACDGRRYPWGDAFEASRANSLEAERGTTLPVDALPEGASPVGCLGMAGNVAEWTASTLDVGEAHVRCVCGGSWATRLAPHGLARVEQRLAGARDHRTGFRLVARLPGPTGPS